MFCRIETPLKTLHYNFVLLYYSCNLVSHMSFSPMHIKPFLASIYINQALFMKNTNDPFNKYSYFIPSLQERRNVRVGSCSDLILISASSTMGPVLKDTVKIMSVLEDFCFKNIKTLSHLFNLNCTLLRVHALIYLAESKVYAFK